MLINMGMDKYGCFMQMYVYYYWNHSQHRAWKVDVSKVIDVFQRTCSCLLYTWKKKYHVLITSLSLHGAVYLHKPVYISAGQASSLLLNMQNVLHCLLLHLFASLYHILYFDAAKFSIKQFSFIYFTVSVVRQWNEYEKVIEMRPIKTT